MSEKVSFYTLGCRLNQSETASIRNSLETVGYAVVDSGQPSDIVVINTCTVTEGGDADTRRLVNKVGRLNPKARIALVGCQAQVQKGKLAALPNVRWIVGNQRKMDLARIFQEHPAPHKVQVLTPAIERGPFTLPAAAVDRRHTRANIKIQDGCDFFCSFCEIPYARGRARSRMFSDIMAEARSLCEAGHKELVLTGINIGTYNNGGRGLMDVISGLGSIAGVERLRISSIEPTTVPPGIFGRMNTGKLCRHLHIPLQSGDDAVLAAMKRKYTAAQFADFIRQAHARVPQLCVGTDVIVGFPGETDEHFAATADFLREAPVHYFHVFSYSPRQMAKSRLLRTLPGHVINERSRILRELSARKRRMFHESLLGSTQRVLCEGREGGVCAGLTDNYVKVRFNSKHNLRNHLVPVRLKSAGADFIEGEAA